NCATPDRSLNFLSYRIREPYSPIKTNCLRRATSLSTIARPADDPQDDTGRESTARVRGSLPAGGQVHHLLHVRVPLRHQGDAGRPPRAVHPGEPRSSGQPGRTVRERLGRHHEAVLGGEAPAAAPAGPRRRAWRGKVRTDLLGPSPQPAHRAPQGDPRERSEEARVLYGPRPDAGADRAVGAAVRHAELGGARRVLL